MKRLYFLVGALISSTSCTHVTAQNDPQYGIFPEKTRVFVDVRFSTANPSLLASTPSISHAIILRSAKRWLRGNNHIVVSSKKQADVLAILVPVLGTSRHSTGSTILLSSTVALSSQESFESRNDFLELYAFHQEYGQPPREVSHVVATIGTNSGLMENRSISEATYDVFKGSLLFRSWIKSPRIDEDTTEITPESSTEEFPGCWPGINIELDSNSYIVISTSGRFKEKHPEIVPGTTLISINSKFPDRFLLHPYEKDSRLDLVFSEESISSARNKLIFISADKEMICPE